MHGRSFLQRFHAKVYAGSWKNPLFADPKAKERSHERVKYVLYSLLMLTGVTACCSGLYWFATQEQFAITQVQGTGMRSMPNSVIVRDTYRALHNCTRFTIPCMYQWNVKKADLNALKRVYPLEHLSATLEGHIFHIAVQEAVTMIPLRIGQDIWFATPSGVLQKKASAEDIAAGIVIPPEAYSEIDVSVLVGEGREGLQVGKQELFENIAKYRKAFSTQELVIQTFTITADAGRVVAKTPQGFDIYFTPWKDAQQQVARLASVLAQATPQAYADIRFDERIYVK